MLIILYSLAVVVVVMAARVAARAECDAQLQPQAVAVL
jgi:hypothetical protein